jgi:hypothetical protein
MPLVFTFALRLAASFAATRRLGLDWPEHGRTLDRFVAEGNRGLRWDAGTLVFLAPASQ